MIYYKTQEEIELIRQSCLLVSKTLAHVASILRPGMTGLEIDKAAEMFIQDHGAKPAFKGYRGFPATLCVSTNDIVVHGIPSDRPFADTDIVSVDCGVCLNGYFGDAAYTFAFQKVDEVVMQLLRVTRESLYRGIENAVAGKRLGDISYAVYELAEKDHHYGIVRELVGHGVGKALHEEPNVPNYGKRGQGLLLREGLVIAIEPMINMGKKEITMADDDWTVLTRDHKPSAHFEHTVAVKKNKADILTDHSPIEEAIKKNAEIREIQ